jgi:hypothetical protein
MTSRLFERIDSYYLSPSKIGKTLRKHQSLQKYNVTYLYAIYLSLNRFFQFTAVKAVQESQNQASEKRLYSIRRIWNGK